MMRISASVEAPRFGAARKIAVALLCSTAFWSVSAQAAGTAAGTTISNTATASFTDPGGNPQTIDSNTVEIKVDELLDVLVDATDPGDVVTNPGNTNQVLTYTVSNTGNGNEAYTLTANGTVGGDNFDPTVTQIYLDNPSAGTPGVYDPGVDILYTPGANDPLLAPDTSVTVFVVSTIPAGAADTERGIIRLTAEAVTGTGTPGTSFAGQGDGGGDAVVGTTGGDGQDDGAFVISNATISFVKSSSILDPFGGSESVPGAIITYQLVATVSGTGTLTNLAIGDNVPANTSYEAGTITLQGAGLTDAADADAGNFTGSAVNVNLGNVPGGNTRTVTFKVKIN